MWERQARHCPLCAAALCDRELDGRARRACPACRFVLYQNPAAAAAAVVLRGGQVLLIRRGIEPFRGTWTLPAGYEEVDERPEQTVVRETREETGLEVVPYGLFDVCYTADDPRKRGLLIVYLCEVIGGDVVAGDDALDAAFFALDALPDPIGFANNRRILARVVDEVRGAGLRYVPVDGAASGRTDG